MNEIQRAYINKFRLMCPSSIGRKAYIIFEFLKLQRLHERTQFISSYATITNLYVIFYILLLLFPANIIIVYPYL